MIQTICKLPANPLKTGFETISNDFVDRVTATLRNYDQILVHQSCFRSVELKATVTIDGYFNIYGKHGHDLAVQLFNMVGETFLYHLQHGEDFSQDLDPMEPMTKLMNSPRMDIRANKWQRISDTLNRCEVIVFRERLSLLAAQGVIPIGQDLTAGWSVEKRKADWCSHFEIKETAFREWVSSGKIVIQQTSKFAKSCRISIATLNAIKPLPETSG